LTRLRAGIKIAINIAIIAITTRSSIKVKAFGFFMMILLSYLRFMLYFIFPA